MYSPWLCPTMHTPPQDAILSRVGGSRSRRSWGKPAALKAFVRLRQAAEKDVVLAVGYTRSPRTRAPPPKRETDFLAG